MAIPNVTTIKILFALSCNTCAYHGCEETLTDPKWQKVKADVAHICGLNPGSARHDPAMSDEDKNSYENLILICPNHHRQIDDLEPNEHPSERLIEMKESHQKGCKGLWAPDADLFRYAVLAIGSSYGPNASLPPPKLMASLAGNKVRIANPGEVDAFAITVEPGDEESRAVLTEASAMDRLSPGGSIDSALYAPSLATAGPHSVLVRWHGEDGESYSGKFGL